MDGYVDVEGLDLIARASEDGEGYLLVARGDGFRIGLVAHAVQGAMAYSMEFLVRVMDREHAVDPARMEHALAMTRALTGRGYTLRNEDDGWIYAERAVDPCMVDDEGRFLKGLAEALGP